MNYDEIKARLEEAYRRSPTAEHFLQEILFIWAEYGIIGGELSCSLEDAV
jgi:hypothetical protein